MIHQDDYEGAWSEDEDGPLMDAAAKAKQVPRNEVQDEYEKAYRDMDAEESGDVDEEEDDAGTESQKIANADGLDSDEEEVKVVAANAAKKGKSA